MVVSGDESIQPPEAQVLILLIPGAASRAVRAELDGMRTKQHDIPSVSGKLSRVKETLPEKSECERTNWSETMAWFDSGHADGSNKSGSDNVMSLDCCESCLLNVSMVFSFSLSDS